MKFYKKILRKFLPARRGGGGDYCHGKTIHESTYWDYADWFKMNIKKAPSLHIYDVSLATSLPVLHPCLLEVRKAMRAAEMSYVDTDLFPLLQNVPGDIVEFGVYTGTWLERLYALCVKHGYANRNVIGFDSFAGLSEPDPMNDFPAWEKGMFSADYETVAQKLRINERSNLKLYKGWFSESFKLPEVRQIDKIAYARIDCDIYPPALECFAYLEDRLSDGAIVVCDDWNWHLAGEAKALHDWLPNSKWDFEFLFYIGYVQMYFRVHKKQPAICVT